MTTPTPTAYPLQWPHGWPKTDPNRRERGAFQTKLPAALANLKKQLNMMGAKGLVISSNYTLGSETPKDSGVCAFFTWQELPMAIPCDRWYRIEHNVQAIALTVEAMRGMERWGAKHMIRAMFTGFKALPAGPTEAWWQVLGVHELEDNVEMVKAAYRELVKKHHPDNGGDAAQFIRVQQAFETFEKSLPKSAL